MGARAMSGGGRRFIDDAGGGEDIVIARRSADWGALEAEEETDAVRLGDMLWRVVGFVEERGLCTGGEALVLMPPAVNLLVLGDTTYGPVGEAGISTLLRKE